MRDILQRYLSNHAIDKVMKLFDMYLLPSEKKPRISEICHCNNNSSSGSGFPCINLIKEYSETKQLLTLAHFHPHWRLTESDHAIKQPHLVRGRGRLAEDTRRVVSSFEVVDS